MKTETEIVGPPADVAVHAAFDYEVDQDEDFEPEPPVPSGELPDELYRELAAANGQPSRPDFTQ